MLFFMLDEGTCGTAAFRRELVVTEDIARDPNWERFRSLALGHNLRSCWSVPLLSHQGNVLGTLFTYNPNPVFALDLAGNIQSVNPAGLKLKPHTATEFMGHHFCHLVLEEDLERVSQHFCAARAGEPQRFEARVLDESEKLLTMDISNLPIMMQRSPKALFPWPITSVCFPEPSRVPFLTVRFALRRTECAFVGAGKISDSW